MPEPCLYPQLVAPKCSSCAASGCVGAAVRALLKFTISHTKRGTAATDVASVCVVQQHDNRVATDRRTPHLLIQRRSMINRKSLGAVVPLIMLLASCADLPTG